jgi:hypothetical protein
MNEMSKKKFTAIITLAILNPKRKEKFTHSVTE